MGQPHGKELKALSAAEREAMDPVNRHYMKRIEASNAIRAKKWVHTRKTNRFFSGGLVLMIVCIYYGTVKKMKGESLIWPTVKEDVGDKVAKKDQEFLS